MRAVKVTLCPDTDGSTEATTVVLMLALPTVCVEVAVLPRKFASPL
jgi:hypothetical protein